MQIPFTVNELVLLAKIGSNKLVADRREKGFADWESMILPGSESETFDEIENALRERFPDGVIVADIA